MREIYANLKLSEIGLSLLLINTFYIPSSKLITIYWSLHISYKQCPPITETFEAYSVHCPLLLRFWSCSNILLLTLLWQMKNNPIFSDQLIPSQGLQLPHCLGLALEMTFYSHTFPSPILQSVERSCYHSSKNDLMNCISPVMLCNTNNAYLGQSCIKIQKTKCI